MSDLRQQLDQLRGEYQSQRYAGDLSLIVDQVTPARPQQGGWPLAAVASAAALLVAVWLGGVGGPGADPAPETANGPKAGVSADPVRGSSGAKWKLPAGALRLDLAVVRKRVELPTAASLKQKVTRRAFSLGYRKYRPAFAGGKRVQTSNNLAKRTPSRPATTVAFSTVKTAEPLSNPAVVRSAFDSSVPRVNRLSTELSLQTRS